MGIESLLGIIAGIIVPTIAGISWLNERSNRRIDHMLEKNDKRVEIVLTHVQKVESTLNDLRSDLPLRYTLREDYLRLSDRVANLELHCQRMSANEPV
jgi:hypothetical protein